MCICVEDWVRNMFEIVDKSRGKYIPAKAFAGDAGFDLSYSATELWMERLHIEPGERWLVGTNVRLEEGALAGGVGLICPRSGLAHKEGVTVLNSPGVIDANYRGEIKVNLYNASNEDVVITEGMRIAQLVCVPIMGSVGGFGEGIEQRGAGGHGSSGR